MSPTIRHKYKYFHSTVQRAKDRRQKVHFCRLPFHVRPRNFKLNLANVTQHDRSTPANRDQAETTRTDDVEYEPEVTLIAHVMSFLR